MMVGSQQHADMYTPTAPSPSKPKDPPSRKRKGREEEAEGSRPISSSKVKKVCTKALRKEEQGGERGGGNYHGMAPTNNHNVPTSSNSYTLQSSLNMPTLGMDPLPALPEELEDWVACGLDGFTDASMLVLGDITPALVSLQCISYW